MAGLVHPTPQFGFHPAPVNHSPSPLGFGFGLTSSHPHSAWQPQSQSALLAHSSSSTPSASHSYSKHAQKRRLDDNEDELRDEVMDRSPTPERTRRIIAKRTRVFVEQASHSAGNEDSKAAKDATQLSKASDGVDVGMLLASLPPQSLLPILTSLLAASPTLKDNVLALIPRPTLETALQALSQAVKKLREAYPYSTPSNTTASFGFGGNHFATSRISWGQPSSRAVSPQSATSGMRDSYVISRLRPHVSDYVATACSYMPYFSFRENADQLGQSRTGKESAVVHPTETFAYLSTLTNHLISQPQLAQQLLSAELMSRLVEEWLAWVAKVDAYVNKEGGMFGKEVVKGWERTLDEFAAAKVFTSNGEFEAGMRTIRDRWVSQVGWLVGRDSQNHAMEEEEEL